MRRSAPSYLMSEERFWRDLLTKRVTHTWGNFSWFSLSTVLSSANDTLDKLDGGRIVDNRRMRWVAAQRAAGRNPYDPVRLPDAKKLLLLGDPGEMDASQYVLVRDLHEIEADALLLMSDVVYPAGDINAWRDAVYLPYLGEPAAAWREASKKHADVKLRRRPLFAMPGNHDWYDGLNGFMYHACSAEPLPPVQFSTAGLGFVERLTRRAWQNPARPDRPMLEPLRAAAAACWESEGAVTGPLPLQPGPYFAIDIGSVGLEGDERAGLRVIAVDTGIDGSIDTEQERWIKEMLEEPGLPKIVITGKPLVTGNTVRDFPVNPPRRTDRDHWQPRGLMNLLSESSAQTVVATVAGDVHNFQRMILAGDYKPDTEQADGQRKGTLKLEPSAFDTARALRLAPVNIVAGGGGAFLSATHPTVLGERDSLTLEGDDTGITLLPALHHRFPSRAASAQRFALTVGAWAGFVLVVVGVALAAVALLIASEGELAHGRDVEIGARDLPLWHVTGAAYALVIFVACCAFASSQRPRGKMRMALAVGLALIMLLPTLALWRVDYPDAAILLAGTALVLAIPLLPLALPILQAFPFVQRYVPTRLILGTVVGAAGVAVADWATSFKGLTAFLLLGLIVAILGVVAVRRGVEKVIELHDDWAVRGVNKRRRRVIKFLSLWPLLWIVALAIGIDEIRGLDGFKHLVVLMLLLDLGVLTLALAVLFGRSLFRTWRFAPWQLAPAVTVAALAGAPVFVLAADAFLGLASRTERGAAAVVGAAALAFALTGLVLWNQKPAAHDDVAAALRRRDTTTGRRPRGLAIFRTMLVAEVPHISEIAEATAAPFHKSFLTVETAPEGGTVIFRVYGVDQERSAKTPAADEQNPPPPDAKEPLRGAFLVDELTVQLEGAS